MAKKKVRKDKYEEKTKFEGTFDELINLSVRTKMPSKRGKNKDASK